jgi:hypothetical protein
MAGPLKGLKILDFTTHLQGPSVRVMLADIRAGELPSVSGSRPGGLRPPCLPGTNLFCAIAARLMGTVRAGSGMLFLELLGNRLKVIGGINFVAKGPPGLLFHEAVEVAHF